MSASLASRAHFYNGFDGPVILGQGWSDPGAQLFVAPVGQHETGGRGRKKKKGDARKKRKRSELAPAVTRSYKADSISKKLSRRQREGDKQDSSLALNDVSQSKS